MNKLIGFQAVDKPKSKKVLMWLRPLSPCLLHFWVVLGFLCNFFVAVTI